MTPLIDVPTAIVSEMALVLALFVLALRRAERSLRTLASTEPLTGLANRREIDRVLGSEIARTSRTARSFAVVLLDLDRLKLINDRCGHRAGDRAIKRVANALRAARRATDTAGRLGGDEFAVILPEADCAAAQRFLARVRELLAGHRRTGTVTVSAGIAEHPRDGATPEALLDAADRALYTDKLHRWRATPASVPRVSREGVRAAI